MSVDHWWNDTDTGTEVWTIGGMVLTGNRSVERWWNDTDREQNCGALVEWY